VVVAVEQPQQEVKDRILHSLKVSVVLVQHHVFQEVQSLEVVAVDLVDLL
tara:strand:+ start:447 stop:596 length:150 start_codon:yes stop_codon:yes gene_type:complete